MLKENSNLSSLTMIMPAYNEAGALRDAYETATRAINKAGISDYEILFITNTSPNGNHDGTPDIASQITEEDKHARLIHYDKYVGLGFKYKQGVSNALKDYVMMVPGDSDTVEESLVSILKHLGEKDMVITYTVNPKARPLYVRSVSKAFVLFCNLLFGLNMKYYNGICIYRKKLIEVVPAFSESPAYNAEILIYLLKSGVQYVETAQEIKKSSAGKTFRLASVMQAARTLSSLFWKIHFKKMRIRTEYFKAKSATC
ncbi:MAG: Glycosyl transferase, group 2 family protein [Candidatus Beckwithbacteria bacterium GW2011_GWA2_43_10]|uniref:Glycosyl transferase, group 2 family protein n=1 Tax=Candidatus Beckwithbacteria bacterium GW2011_GWA2_43_10 TaxID=1618369 RepID=A0A0G1C3U7_9BACT|nr:MAG: Glycosyl transferase, group 2 family protein [Candidatus Beckwithbacteria bacterium GW2011_GWA2_43_10]